MEFTFPVEIYSRLAKLTRIIPADDKGDLRGVLLERKNNETYAVASNRRIAAIYYLGKTVGEDGIIQITNDEALIAQCDKEAAFSATLQVVAIPALKMATIKTIYGYQYPGNAALPEVDNRLAAWRDLTDYKPAASSHGAMAWTTDEIMALSASSMSGHIVFPEIIDVRKPIYVRDLKYPEWVGVFMGSRKDDSGRSTIAEPSTIPTWWK